MELIIRLELRERNRIYTPQEKYITCDAQFPGTALHHPFPPWRRHFPLFRSFTISSTPTWCPPSSRPPNRREPREEEQKTVSRRNAQGAENGQKPPPPDHPFWLAACLRVLMIVQVHHSEISRDSVDEAWPQTGARPQPKDHHAHRSRSDQSESLLVCAGLARG